MEVAWSRTESPAVLSVPPAAISREPPSSSSDRVAVTVPPITVRAIASAEAEDKASVPILLTLPFRTSVPSLAITALDVLTLPFNTSVFSPVLTKSAPFPFTIRFPLKTESSKSLASSIFKEPSPATFTARLPVVPVPEER